MRLGIFLIASEEVVLVELAIESLLMDDIDVFGDQLIVAPGAGNGDICHGSDSQVGERNPSCFKLLQGRRIIVRAVVDDVIRAHRLEDLVLLSCNDLFEFFVHSSENAFSAGYLMVIITELFAIVGVLNLPDQPVNIKLADVLSIDLCR